MAAIFEFTTEAQWDELICKSLLPIVIEFFTPWCEPCKELHPIIDKLNKDCQSAMFYRYNCDELHYRSDKLAVFGIPTIILFLPPKSFGLEPEVFEVVRGYATYDTLRAKVDSLCEEHAKAKAGIGA